MSHSRTIGLIGLGLVGRAVGRRLREAGWQTWGFDRAEPAREQFQHDGGNVCSGAAEVGERADRVILSVFDSSDVSALISDSAGLLQSGSVQTIIDCTTGDPKVSAAMASDLIARGIQFIEAPWSGSSQQIESGEATLLLAGDPVAVGRNMDLFDILTGKPIYVGEAGMAARAKLATNLVLGLNRAALAEGFAFAEALGLRPEDFLELVLATPATSAAAQAKGAKMVSRDFTPQSRIRQHLKDVELMLAAAQAVGVELPLSEVHHRLMQRAVAEGDGDLDNAGILRQWRVGARQGEPDAPGRYSGQVR